MDENRITELVNRSKSSVPTQLWSCIKKDIARGIANELLEKLEKQKAPCKQENMDREYSLIFIHLPKILISEGEKSHGL